MTTTARTIRCAECWYAKKFVSPETLGRDTFLCLRFPPSMVAHGAQVSSLFPVVAAEAVCGEHRPRAGSQTAWDQDPTALKPWESGRS